MSFIFFMLVVVALLWAVFWLNERKNMRTARQELKESWGRPPRKYRTADQIRRLSAYAEQKSGSAPFSIDPITWRDLDMDRLFMQMDGTVSAPGEEYLLYLLRTPMLDEARLWERDALIRLVAEDEQRRLDLQMLLSQISQGGAHPIGEGLQGLKRAAPVGRAKHWTLCAAAVLSLAFMFIQPVYGFFLFLGVACLNTADYYMGGDRKQVEVYLGCFRDILQMMRAAKDIEAWAEDAAWGQIDGLCARMRQARQELRAFAKGSYWLSGKGHISGGIEAVLADLIRMVFHADLIIYNAMLQEIYLHEQAAWTLMETLGELDCAIAAASFREMLPVWCRPVFEKTMDLQAEGIYHPMVKDPVPNDLYLEKSMLLTGSNASGKSTFLRAVALNALLAQTIATCPAASYRAPMCRIYTSMALSDDLEKKESYFMAEIRSLKRILDAASQEIPMLCMADEVLRGTNTIERIAAAAQILLSLRREQVICLAATHDIELTYILEAWYENYHFGEEVRERDVLFSYELKKGRASTRNAIRLLEMMGYDEKIVRGAGRAARAFEESGIWPRS